MPDYPDGWQRSSPGHVTEFDTKASVMWSEETSLSIASLAVGHYILTFDNDDWVYLIDNIYVGWTSLSYGHAYVYQNSIPVAAVAVYPTMIIPLKDNPSLQFIKDDVLSIDVLNAEATTRSVIIVVAGTKFPKPAGFGHPPSANFSSSVSGGDTVQFTDESLYSPTAYEWDFDDGSPVSVLSDPEHVYAVAGTYHVRLKVTNSHGWDSYNDDVVVTGPRPDGVVDFTTFTEVDVGAKLTLSAAKIVATAAPCNAAAYAYFDYGADYFDAIDVVFRAKVTAMSGYPAFIAAMALFNSVGDLYPTAGYKVMVRLVRLEAGFNIEVGLFSGVSDIVTDSMSISADTEYYLRVERAAGATTLTVKVYSDSARTTLLDTLSITNANLNTKFRYLYGMSAVNFSSAVTCSAESGDMELL